jgi:hypothetical protein
MLPEKLILPAFFPAKFVDSAQWIYYSKIIGIGRK